MQLLPLMKGAATYIPGLYKPERGATGGTSTARYCYAVWMRHATLVAKYAGVTRFERIAELGPGDSIGIGLTALLSGVSHLEALDVVHYARATRNRLIFGQLVDLFRQRASIPDDGEFPRMQPKLERYGFPSSLYSEQDLGLTLDEGRVRAINLAMEGQSSEVSINYRVPWDQHIAGRRGQLDLVFSQAVLEHVVDVRETQFRLAELIKPGGIVSHAIDFRSHCLTPDWDGHLQYPERLWRIVKGRRPYLLNRCSPTQQLDALESAGFEVMWQGRIYAQPSRSSARLPIPFRNWSPDDHRTAALTVIARRKGSPNET
ncbi:MAG: hypothetical protein KIS79_04110 [Burkholderiales bacterium]|nr:hypothetical protein [Burkholderiales bacterium]